VIWTKNIFSHRKLVVVPKTFWIYSGKICVNNSSSTTVTVTIIWLSTMIYFLWLRHDVETTSGACITQSSRNCTYEGWCSIEDWINVMGWLGSKCRLFCWQAAQCATRFDPASLVLRKRLGCQSAVGAAEEDQADTIFVDRKFLSALLQWVWMLTQSVRTL